MRKLLLVLLVGLLSVASFATVSFSGSASAGVSVTMNLAGNIALDIPWDGYFVASSSDSSENTGFSAYFGKGFDAASFYIWQYLYKTDPLSVWYKLGTLSWGTEYVNNAGAAMGLLFDMVSGDLTDSLGVYAYFPAATSVDLDVYNHLEFLYFTIDVAAVGIVSAGAGSFPDIGADVTIDLGEALGLPEGSSLNAFAYFGLDPSEGDVTSMLSDYQIGASYGYDTVTGSFSFTGPTGVIDASFETTALDPVTLGGWVEFPLNLAAFLDIGVGGYIDWTYELLNNEVYVELDAGVVTAGWEVTVYY